MYLTNDFVSNLNIPKYFHSKLTLENGIKGQELVIFYDTLLISALHSFTMSNLSSKTAKTTTILVPNVSLYASMERDTVRSQHERGLIGLEVFKVAELKSLNCPIFNLEINYIFLFSTSIISSCQRIGYIEGYFQESC